MQLAQIIISLILIAIVYSQQGVTIKVFLNQNRKDVSPYIFGVNHASAEQLAQVPYTVNRKGGNADTRYNWKRDIHNTASDWFYMNIPNKVDDESKLPEGTTSTKFVDESRAANCEPMLTASLIGYTPLDEREKNWGFSVQKYGTQQKTECTETGNAFWCTADAGNGITPGNQKITNNDWRDTSKQINETFVQEWIEFLNQRNTPVKFWSLDNEV